MSTDSEKSNVPRIRFPGFKEPWEQRKLGDLVTFLDSKRKPLEASKRIKGPYPYYGASGIVDYVDGFLFDESLILLSEDGANILDRNYPVCFKITGKAWVNNHAHVLKPNTDISEEFLYNFLEKLDYSQFNTGMAMPKLNREVCEKIPVILPTHEEQQKIGSALELFNNLITLHQRQLEELKNLKSGLLQKMFPKTGKQIPDIRFPGFTEPWEQRKLRNISELITGGTPNTKRDDYWSPPEIPWMASGEINKKLINQPSRYISKLGFENSSSKWVPKNSVLIALAGQGKTRGMCAYTTIPITINQSLAAVVPNSLVNPKFLLYDLERRYEDLRAMSSGDVTRGGLNKALLADLTVNLPSLKEQTRIGEIFRDLEDLITLHQR